MLSFIQSITITILLAFVLRVFVLQPFIVEGSSMEPNFHDKEYIVIDKISYRFREPKRGEVIVFHPPVATGQNYIKRIIGLPGEKVHIDHGKVYINNQPLDEPYLDPSLSANDLFNTDSTTPLGPHEYFVMGDNRNHSSDSREWGILPQQNIEGRTWLVILPLRSLSIVNRPNYPGIVSSALGASTQGAAHPIQ